MEKSIKIVLIGSSLVALAIIVAIVVAILLAQDENDGASDKNGRITLEASQYTSYWPLTVERGKGECREPTGFRKGQAIFITADGIAYGMNSDAVDAGYPSIVEITKPSPDLADYTMSLNPILDPTLFLCKRR